MPYKLLPSFQAYPWGDLGYIQNLCNMQDRIGTPIAEMWLGAHPRSSSRILVGEQLIPLNIAIEADPERHLGKAIDIYSKRLPYLFKVLAAAKPLSIQLHPDKQTAGEGFDKENALGIALDDPKRTYKDDNHKPELICALTPFMMLCGFRPYYEITSILEAFSLEKALQSAANFIHKPSSFSLKLLYSELMHLQPEDIKQLVEQKMFAARAVNTLQNDIIETCHTLQQFFPDDVGVLAPLFLNIITLKPGEALFLKAGVLHSYIHGVGLELMANSDNVIRGGLTDKYIDLDALFSIADFSEYQTRILNPFTRQGVASYPSPTPEFQLVTITVEGNFTFPINRSPHIILVLEGTAYIPELGELSIGEAAYYPASELSIAMDGKARIAVVGIA